MILHHYLPETHQLARLVVLLVDRLQRPVDPARLRPLPRVPVGDQDVQGLLYQGAYLVVALAQTLEAPDQGQVKAQCFVGVKAVKSADVVAGPNESVVFDDFVLDPQEAPNSKNHGVSEGLVEDIFDSPQGQVADLQHFHCDPVVAGTLAEAEAGEPFVVKQPGVEADLYCLRK